MNHRWLMTMALWTRTPPSERKVLFVLGILVICLALVVVEWLVGWPAWLTVNDGPRGGLR